MLLLMRHFSRVGDASKRGNNGCICLYWPRRRISCRARHRSSRRDGPGRGLGRPDGARFNGHRRVDDHRHRREQQSGDETGSTWRRHTDGPLDAGEVDSRPDPFADGAGIASERGGVVADACRGTRNSRDHRRSAHQSEKPPARNPLSPRVSTRHHPRRPKQEEKESVEPTKAKPAAKKSSGPADNPVARFARRLPTVTPHIDAPATQHAAANLVDAAQPAAAAGATRCGHVDAAHFPDVVRCEDR